ncbi:MAG TPA: outer membrane beta-barrel protein [Pseudolabrys sp.]|nr:outer membrane beta-barrel protein [Pseudolabrys sp.]
MRYDVKRRADIAGSRPFLGTMTLACMVAFSSSAAFAQIVTPDADPLAPKQAGKPQTFQKFGPQQQQQLAQTPGFTPPPSGAGSTGYDSTNSRRAKAKKQVVTQKPGSASRAQALPGDQPTPLTLSPYQKPFPTEPKSAMAQGTGQAPVEFGPIRKPLKKRRAETIDDPYAPLGVHAGGFLLYPAIELSGGYSTNPGQTSSNPQGASLYSAAPELRAQSNWSRHELKADLRGSYTGYTPDTTPTLSRPYVNGKVDGRVDVTRTTRLDLGSRVLVSTDNPSSPNLQAGLSKLPIFTTYGGSVGVGKKFNRLDVSLKGDAERTFYQDSKLTDGTTASNKDRNYDQYGVTLRGGYELSPGITPYVEGAVDTRRHDLATDFSGYQRNSKGWTATVGSTFELSRLLTGETGIGYTERKYDDPRLEKLSGVVGNASLIWTASSLTTVQLNAKSAVQESTVAGVSGVLSRDVGLQVDHSFRRWLIGSVKAGYGNDDYRGSSRDDNRYMAALGLTYKLSRWAQVKGEFRQDWLRSNFSGNNYNVSTFMLGVRLQQ